MTVKLKNGKLSKRVRLRMMVLSYLTDGRPQCDCCMEKRLMFLTIDHINGGGRAHRNEHKGRPEVMYREILEDSMAWSKYRVLCWNCNCAMGIFGFCPHDIKKLVEFESKRKVPKEMEALSGDDKDWTVVPEKKRRHKYVGRW